MVKPETVKGRTGVGGPGVQEWAPDQLTGERDPEKRKYRLYAGVSLIGFFAGWYLLTINFIPPLFFPSPYEVAVAFTNLRFSIAEHVGMSMFRIVVGFSMGCVAGVAIGLAMSWSRGVQAALDPHVENFRPIPPIAAIPFFVLWFGIGEKGKLILIALACLMIMVVTTVEAVKNVQPIYIRAASTLGASKHFIYRTIIVPAITPALISGIRISAAAAFAVNVAGEFMGAQSGLGYMIMTARRMLQTENILLGIIIIGVLSSSLDRMIRWAGDRVTAWTEKV